MTMKLSSCVCTLIALVVPLVHSSAQYTEGKDYAPLEARYFTLGFVDREFVPLMSNSLSDSLAIRFKRIMPMISFKQGATELFFGYTTYSLSGNSKTSVFFGGRFGAEVPIIGRRSSVLLFPLQLAADFTKAEGLGPSRENFNIASVGIGVGLKYRYVGSGMDFSAGVDELAQYCSEGISTGNGFSAATLGDATLLLRSVNVLEGLVVGYRFRLQTWSMSESKFRYRSVSHGPYVGIMF